MELESPLLSRFDLIFTMRERYERAKIEHVAEAIVQGRDAAARLAADEPLPDELRDLVEPEIPIDVFQAYVANANELRPTATEAAKDRTQAWYTELKTTLPDRYTAAIVADGQAYEGPPLPVTARKLDACYRLAEASARLRISETVTVDDVEYVTPFIERSLADIGIAATSNIAFGGVGDLEAAEVGLSTD